MHENRLPLAVVIPIGEVDDLLYAQLDALALQQPPAGSSIVLSCNGCSPKDVAVDRKRFALLGWDLILIDSSSTPGPSAARNAGWRAATQDVILFCDADDVVENDWVSTLAESAAQYGIAGGALDHARLNPPGLAALYSTAEQSLPTRFHYLPYAPSCNLGAKRSLLSRLDGFDESLLAGEDTDLCWRAHDAGYPIRFEPRAVVAYRLRTTPQAAFHQARTYARADHSLLRRYAAARFTLNDRIREVAGAMKSSIQVLMRRRPALVAATRWGTVLGRLH